MHSHSSCSDESNLSEISVNPRSSYRVSVCLRRCFSDIRARCFILVSKKRRVRWLEQRLRKLFTLRGGFYLCANGHLLPSSEPLAVLNPDDCVEVVPHEEGAETVDAVCSHSKINNNCDDHYGEGTSDNSYLNQSLVTNKVTDESFNSNKVKNIYISNLEHHKENKNETANHEVPIQISTSVTSRLTSTHEDVDMADGGLQDSFLDVGVLEKEKRRALTLLDERFAFAAPVRAEPVAVAQPTTVAESAESRAPAEYAKSLAPAELAKFVEPAELAKFVEPAELAKFVEPAELAKFAEPAKLVEPAEPARLVDPAVLALFADLTKFAMSAELAKFAEPAESAKTATPRRRRVRRRRPVHSHYSTTSPLDHGSADNHSQSPLFSTKSNDSPKSPNCSQPLQGDNSTAFSHWPNEVCSVSLESPATSLPDAPTAGPRGAPVTRNNANCPRKPRLIQPVLEIKNTHITFPV